MFICLEVKNKTVIQQTITMRLDDSVVDAPIMSVIRVINELIGGYTGNKGYFPATNSDGIDDFICQWLGQFNASDGYKLVERRQAFEKNGCGRCYTIPSKFAFADIEQLQRSLKRMQETLADEADDYENFKNTVNDKLETLHTDICNIRMMS